MAQETNIFFRPEGRGSRRGLHRRGPAATTILSDFGADVIKVEAAGHRRSLPLLLCHAAQIRVSSTNYAWQLTNRNKRSLALDLQESGAKDVLARLVQWADVAGHQLPGRTSKAKLGLT